MIITLEEAQAYLGLSATTSAQNSLITTFIELVGAEIEAYTDRKIEYTSITNEILKYNISDFDLLPTIPFDLASSTYYVKVKEYPISNLVVEVDDEVIPSTDYTLYANEGIINFESYYNDSFDNLTATYSAGYTIANMPNDIKLVAYEGVKEYWAKSGTTSQGIGNIKSKDLGDFSVTYNNNYELVSSGSMKYYLAANKTILNRYLRTDL